MSEPHPQQTLNYNSDTEEDTHSQPNSPQSKTQGESDADETQKESDVEGESEVEKAETISVANNAATDSDFRWHNNGNKSVAGSDGIKHKKSYYACASSSSSQCKAKKYVHHIPNNLVVTYHGEHNHHAPATPRIRSEVKKEIKSQLSNGGNVAKIHRRLVTEAPLPISRKDVPTISQMYNWSHDISIQDLPTGDAMRNVIKTHKLGFLQCVNLFPKVHIVFAGEFGLGMLTQTKHAIVDGTFDLCEGKLILTTIMAYKDGIAIPAAYLISNSKTEDNYKAFFDLIKAKTDNRFNPKGVLMDFEEALGNAWTRTFPACSLWRDFFHFQQANTRKARELGLNSIVKDVIVELRKLWHAPAKTEFGSALVKFLDDWDEKYPQYTRYFRKTWLDTFHSETWASFGRPKGAPSGSGALEGHHNRLQNHVMPTNPQDVDKFSNMLWKEEAYYSRIASDPILWGEKQRINSGNSAKYSRKRETLRDYTPDLGNDSEEEVEREVSTDKPIRSGKSGREDAGKENLRRNMQDDFDDFDDVVPPPECEAENQAVMQRTDIPTSELCKCLRYRFNTTCSLKKCKKCCVLDTKYCVVTDHMKKKVGAKKRPSEAAASQCRKGALLDQGQEQTLRLIPGMAKKLTQAMIEQKRLHVVYDGGSNPGKARYITPLTWQKKYIHIKALCHKTSPPTEKTFSACRITKLLENGETVEYNKSTQEESANDIEGAMDKETNSLMVQSWLEELGMERYLPYFQILGVDNMKAMSELDEIDLSVMGVEPNHRKLLFEASKALRI